MSPNIQPVGVEIPNWSAPPLPSRKTLVGTYCRLEPLDPNKHAKDLFEANALDRDGYLWTYLPYGPFASFAEYRSWLERSSVATDPLFYVVIEPQLHKAVGLVSYLRIEPTNGCIEVGHLCYSPLLQRTTAATEAMYLMMKQVFELGYRRYEWKCNALNAPSRMAAQRLGFSYEGLFRQSAVVKGRNRDTAWYSIIDTEWPKLQAAYRQWLDPANFVAGGQVIKFSDLTAPLLACCG